MDNTIFLRLIFLFVDGGINCGLFGLFGLNLSLIKDWMDNIFLRLIFLFIDVHSCLQIFDLTICRSRTLTFCAFIRIFEFIMKE